MISHSYQAYLQSPEWAARRQQKLAETGYRCQGCSDDERLEVHHLTYDRVGHERPQDLMVLCHLCHAREHGRAPRVGPIAGPTVEELTARVRQGEGERRRAVLEPAFAAVAVATRELFKGADSRQRKRLRAANNQMSKARREMLSRSVSSELAA